MPDTFPDNVLWVVASRLQSLDGITNVVIRSLNPTDPNGTAGVDADEWQSEDYEMGPLGFEPTIKEYLGTIQLVVKDANAEEGRRLHRVLSKRMAAMLYRDEALNVALRGLVEREAGRGERLMQWKVMGQRFASNEINGTFVSMSATEFSFTTETFTIS